MSETPSFPPPPVYAYESGWRGLFNSWLRLWRFQLRNWSGEWRALFRNPVGIIGIGIIALFGLLALAQPILLNTVWDDPVYDPFVGYDFETAPHPTLPSTRHPFGTDYQGRDVLSRVAFATRTSFGVGLIAALVGTSLATLIGVSAAYFGGWVDSVLMALADVFIMLPPAVVLLIVGLIFEMNLLQVGLLYGVFSGLGSLAILLKAHTLTILNKEHILASRIAGSGNWRIIRRHILPNLVGLITVSMMLIVTGSVMIEALLSYFNRTTLRLSWGTMIWEIQDNFLGGAVGLQWHVLLAPALAIMLFCGAFYLVARTLDEVSNPKLRRR